jgi:hydrogenase-1 operon protein HyaF
MNDIYLPIIGQGSQPKESDGAELVVSHLPDTVHTYSMPKLANASNFKALPNAKALLQTLLSALVSYDPLLANSFSTQNLNSEELAFINEILGEGEVSIIFQSDTTVRIQESVLAGIWRVQQFNTDNQCIDDSIEIADIPAIIKSQTFARSAKQLHFDKALLPDGLMNALPLIAELNAHIADSDAEMAHVINLSLLPQTPEDLEFLSSVLGQGTVSILSRSYGTNRITSTATKNVWWVQYFNSDDTLILNTLEVSSIPSVACAAPEDIEDSGKRLQEIFEVYL